MKTAPDGTGSFHDRVLSVEPIDDRTRPELVELIAIDPLGLAAVSVVPANGMTARFITRRQSAQGRLAPPAQAPAMKIFVGDVRVRTDHVLAERADGTLCIAVVLVDALTLANLRPIAREFDAVIPAIVAARATDIEAKLARAVLSVTVFATANRVRISVDEAYPFFAEGGLMSWGDAADVDVTSAARQAVACVDYGRRSSILLHVESTEDEHLADLRLASETVTQAEGVEIRGVSVSTRVGPVKRVSVIARGLS